MRVLLVVNEPGEFNELLQLARLLRAERLAHCAFVFIRPDYVSIERHGEICRGLGFQYVHADARFSPARVLLALESSVADDYRPTALSWRDPRRDVRKWLAALRQPPELRRLNRVGLRERLFSGLSLAVWPAYPLLRRLRVRARTLNQIAQFRPQLQRVARLKHFALAALRYYKADLVVLGQDFAGSENSVFATVADALQTPVVVLPFAMGTTKEINESLYSLPDYRFTGTLLERHAADRFPKWLNVYRGRLLFRQPPEQVLAFEASGVSSPVPWAPQSGVGTLLLPSQQALDYYVSAGLDPALMRVTGSLNDRWWRADSAERPQHSDAVRWFGSLRRRNTLRNEVVDSVRGMLTEALLNDQEQPAEARAQFDKLRFFLGPRFRPENFGTQAWGVSQQVQLEAAEAPATELQASREPKPDAPGRGKLVLASWVTNQFSRPNPTLEFESYEALSRAWAKTLQDAAREEGATVAVSLHPTLDPARMQYLEDEFGFLIWRGRLIEIIDTADIFIASVSSTLLWANNFGVPSINYDVFRYGYSEFSEAGSIVTVATHYDFETELRRMLTDEAYRVSWTRRSEERRGYWGAFDGRSEGRILAAIDDICGHRESANPEAT